MLKLRDRAECTSNSVHMKSIIQCIKKYNDIKCKRYKRVLSQNALLSFEYTNSEFCVSFRRYDLYYILLGIGSDFLMYYLLFSYDRLIAEKEDLEEELVNYKRQISCTTVGSATKEIRMLKSMVKSLEEELVSEKTKYQRQSSKRNLENRHLQDEVSSDQSYLSAPLIN